MKTALLFLLGTVWLSSHAQTSTFNQFVDFNKSADLATSVVSVSEGYMILGNGLGTADNGFDFPGKLEILLIAEGGNMISKKELGIDSVALSSGEPGSLLTLSDTAFLMIGWYKKNLASNDIDPFFIYFNQWGDTVRTVRWHHPGKWSIPHYGIVTSDQKLLITGAFDNAVGPVDMKTVLYKTDLNLNGEWQKFYNAPGYDEGYHIVELPDSGFIFGSGQGNFTNLYQGRLVSIKKDGSLNWQKIYGSQGLNCGIGNLQLINNNLYGTHCLDTVINSGDEKVPLYIFKSDLNGNVQWRLFFNKPDYVSPWNFKAASDSTFILVGQYMYGGMTSHLPDVGYAAMVDTAGNLLWERIYEFDTIPDFSGRLNDFTITDDNGILFIGQAAFDPIRNSDFWIMKTDSAGCLTPGCDSTSGIGTIEPSFSDHLLQVYPNPASDMLNVQLELNKPAGEITITLRNLQGQAVRQITGSGWNLISEIDVAALPTGVYLLICAADGHKVTSRKVVVD